MLDRDARDRAADTVIEVHETFATGRRLVDRREPMRTGGAARQNAARFMPCHSPRCCSAKSFTCGMSAGLEIRRPRSHRRSDAWFQRACIPDSVARQYFSDRVEHHTIAGVAAQILLPINAAAVLADRRMPTHHQRVVTTPALGAATDLSVLDIAEALQYCSLSLYVRARIASSHFAVS